MCEFIMPISIVRHENWSIYIANKTFDSPKYDSTSRNVMKHQPLYDNDIFTSETSGEGINRKAKTLRA